MSLSRLSFPGKGSARLFALVVCCGLIAGCLSSTPSNRDNICSVFRQKSGWYKDAVKAANHWKGETHVAMAIMAQESAFRARARPPMRFFLGIIPYGRASNAYGYPQALNSTWANYRKEAGNLLSRRNEFDDSIDFIHWYMHKTWTVNRVPKTDAFNQYLNYHEGQGGFRRGSWKNKSWLISVARKVERRAAAYQTQLAGCEEDLRRRSRWLWF